MNSIKVFTIILSVLVCLACLGKTEVSGEIFVSREEGSRKLGAVKINFVPKDSAGAAGERCGDLARLTSDRSTQSDSDGKFKISLPNGEYFAIASSGSSFWKIPVIAVGGSKNLALTSQNATVCLATEQKP